MSQPTDKDKVGHLRAEETTKQMYDDKAKIMSKPIDEGNDLASSSKVKTFSQVKDTDDQFRYADREKMMLSRELLSASKKGDLVKVQQCLSKGCCVDGNRMSVPLCEAAKQNHTGVISALLAAGAVVKNKNMFGGTALENAAVGGHLEAIRLLLDSGADPNEKSRFGGTALGNAAEGGHLEAIRLLLDSGADPNEKSRFGKTALGNAAQGEHLEAMRLLLDSGADPNGGSRFGKTALGNAAQGEHLEAMRLLLDSGADPNGGSRFGKTALGNAAQGEHLEAMRLLLDSGADPNGGSSPFTPLMMAVRNNQTEAVALLVASGADVQQKWCGETALEIAVRMNHTEIIHMLQDYISKAKTEIFKKRDLKQGSIEEKLTDATTREKFIIDLRDIFYPKGRKLRTQKTNVYPRDKASKAWKISSKSGLYHIKEPNLLISIPENVLSTPEDLYIMTKKLKPIPGICNEEDILSDMFTFLPHGSLFGRHILVQFPIKFPKNKNNIQLMFSESDDGEDMKWINLQQNNTQCKHPDDLFWFIDGNKCFLFMRHFCHIFMTQLSTLKPQQAIMLNVSLHALFVKNIKENLYQLEFATGFHCHRCFPELQNDKTLGTRLTTRFKCFYSDEGPVTAKVEVTNLHHWTCYDNDKEINSNDLMCMCNNNGIYAVKSLFYTRNRTNIDPSIDLCGAAKLLQKEKTILDFKVLCTLGMLEKVETKAIVAEANNESLPDDSSSDCTSKAIPIILIDTTPCTPVTYKNMPSTAPKSTNSLCENIRKHKITQNPEVDEETQPDLKKRNYETADLEKTSTSRMNTVPKETPKTQKQNQPLDEESLTDDSQSNDEDGDKGVSCPQYSVPSAPHGNTSIQNQQIIYNIFPTSNLSPHFFGLPIETAVDDCVFSPAVKHEEKQLCQILDNNYKEELTEIAKEVGDHNGTVDMKNLSGLTMLQVWQIHVTSGECTWRQFYDILIKLKCDAAAEQLKVVFEKNCLVKELDVLKHNMSLKDVLGELVSNGIIDLTERNKIKRIEESESTEYLVLDILMKRPHRCIQSFHRILYRARHFKQFLHKLMLCPEDINNL